MIKYFSVFILLFNFLNADINDFDTRQYVLLKMKQVIIEEESLARSYEKYILNNFDIPTLAQLKVENYLETTFASDFDETYFNTYTLDKRNISYGLKEVLKNDSYIKNLYESNTYRSKTFYYKNKIHFILENDLSKHIFNLISIQNSAILDCDNINKKKYCKNDNHIYIYAEDSQTTLLMYYYIDKFKTGPIIITKDTSLHITKDEFNSITKGILLYDIDGVKYIKTSTSIELLK